MSELKAGAAISKRNLARVQAIADHAYAMGAKAPPPDTTPIGSKAQSLDEQASAVRMAVYEALHPSYVEEPDYPYIAEVFTDYAVVCIGDVHWRVNYTTDSAGAITLADRDTWIAVEQVWQPVAGGGTMKAGAALPVEDAPDATYASVKALGDRTLELRVAWGWDTHKEQFHPERTDFDLENYPTPPVAYYHGYTQAGKPAPKPIYIGKTIKRENRADGHYLIAKLNTKAEADRVWAAALKGEAFVSPATAGHFRRKDPDGTLTYWPIVEISAWDGAPTRRQAHPQSIAFPVLKALYDEAGIPLPAPLEPLPPQTPGDGVSAGATHTTSTLSDEEVGRAIARALADTLLAINSEKQHDA